MRNVLVKNCRRWAKAKLLCSCNGKDLLENDNNLVVDHFGSLGGLLGLKSSRDKD